METQASNTEEVVQPQTDESQTESPSQDRAEEAKSDGWEGALEAFENPELENQETPVKEEVKEKVAESKSHFEQDKAGSESLDLEKLPIPQKYKGKVKEFVEPILQETKSQIEATNKTLGEYGETVKGLVEVFKEVASDPRKMPQYIAEYGHILGLDPSVINHYRQSQGQPQQQQPQQQQHQEQQQVQQQASESLEQVMQKYAERMITTQDPREFMALLQAQNFEVANNVQNAMMGKVGQLLKLYHENYIQPDKETLRDFKSRAEEQAHIAHREASKTSWNSAFEKVAGKYSDIKKYEPQIVKLLLEDPDFSQSVISLHENPKELARREKIIERAYQLLSIDDRMSAAKAPRAKFSGLPPTSKHVNTKKTGGDSWEDIRDELWS